MLQAIVARYKAMSGIVRFLIWVFVFSGVLLGGVEYVDAVGQLGGQADLLESRHRERAALRERLDSSKAAFNSAIVAYGTPKLSRTGDVVAELDRRVSTVLAAHNAIEKRRSAKDATGLTMGQISAGGSGNERKLDRVGLEVSFECETSELIAILKDLESSPEISSVGRIEIRKLGEIDKKTGAGYLAVTLAPEVWTFAKTTSGSAEPAITPNKEPANNPAGGSEPDPAAEPAAK